MTQLTANPGCCEEASPLSVLSYIPCNRPAVRAMLSLRDGRAYRMCGMCASHNVRRGLLDVGPWFSNRRIVCVAYPSGNPVNKWEIRDDVVLHEVVDSISKSAMDTTDPAVVLEALTTGHLVRGINNVVYGLIGELTSHPSGIQYNADSVNEAIASSNRHGRRISKREAGAIHRLLRGRH